VSLVSLTKLLRVRSEKEKKAKPSKQEQQRNTNDPLKSPNALELNWGLWADRLLELCLWSRVYCSCIECNVCECLDGWSGGGWGVFIALNHQITVWAGCCRWAHRTVWCANHVTQPLGFWSIWPLEALSCSGTRQSGAAPESTVHYLVRLWPLFWLLPCTVALSGALFAVDRCAGSRYSAGAPDSPVAHRSVRWIIAERAWRNPRVANLILYDPGALDTVRWHTGQSDAPGQSTLDLFTPLNLNPILNIYWFMLNLYAPVEHTF
jgi:hypothetical protein